MKKLCEWLCPKKKKAEGPYDVHEQTFEMDENNMVGIESHEKEIDPTSRQFDKIMNEGKQESHDTLQSQQIQKDRNIKNEDEVDLIKNKSNMQNNNKNEDKKNINNEENNQKKQQNIEIKQIKNEQKIKQNYNILNLSIKKKKINLQDYYFKQQIQQFKIKSIDSLKGQQFNIDNCKNSTYFIFDITANIYIDNSQNCFIFAAPVQSSIFVRSCKNMIIIASSGQFRTYNCHNCHFSIYCKSQPVIESSSQIHFSSLQCPQYPQLRKQFQQVKLQPLNNHWSQIHNFTKKQGETHYYLQKQPQYDLQIDWQRAMNEAKLQKIKQKQEIVPFIQGVLPLEKQQNYRALLIFGEEQSKQEQRILEWIKQKQILLLKTSKTKLNKQKYFTIALLINFYQQQQQLNFQQIGNPIVITQQQDIKQNLPKYFISFKDQR